MYRAIVRRRVSNIYSEINRGNWQSMIDGLADDFVYRFVGDTPLGGTRRTRRAMTLWWQRLFTLFPGSQFSPQAIVVEGPPWNTRVMTHVKITGVVPSANDTQRSYENEFMQLMTLRWGRINSITTLEDTLRFSEILPTLSKAGIADAAADQITD